MHLIGCKEIVPNWVQRMCTQLGAKNVYPIGCKECVPNLVHKMCTQLGVQNMYPIGYIKIYLMGYMNHVFVVFSRIMLPGILLTLEFAERFDTP